MPRRRRPVDDALRDGFSHYDLGEQLRPYDLPSWVWVMIASSILLSVFTVVVAGGR